MIKLIFSGLLLAILLHSGAAAQPVTSRIPGLEHDQTYTSLLQEEQRLKYREDSLTNEVTAVRKQFAADAANRQHYSDRILRLESELFNLRSQMGSVVSRINAVEQQWILRNLDEPVVPAEPKVGTPQHAGKKMLTDNEVFERDLAPEEVQSLQLAQQMEVSVVNYLKIYGHNYRSLKRLIAEYELAPDALTGDSIQDKYEHLYDINQLIADSVRRMWNRVFDTKSYLYGYLLDKSGRSDLLEQFGGKLAGIRQREAETRGRYQSDAVAAYALEKKLLLGYEKELAAFLQLTSAKDSINKVIGNIDTTSFFYPRIALEERSFIDYIPAKIVSPAKYNARNPIPQCVVYPRGTVYRILLGSYTKPQAASIFRGAYPLGWLKKEGRYAYYAGGYASYEDAEKGVKDLLKAGFKKPVVVVWRDGQYAVADGPAAVPAATDAVARYRIEIMTKSPALGSPLRDAIASTAPGKEIARVPSQDGGGYIFTVGSFEGRVAAENVAAALREKETDMDIKIVRIAH